MRDLYQRNTELWARNGWSILPVSDVFRLKIHCAEVSCGILSKPVIRYYKRVSDWSTLYSVTWNYINFVSQQAVVQSVGGSLAVQSVC